MKNFDRKKLFSTTVSMMMTWTICQSVSVNASDIDIYSNATGGKTTITMMLDTSGSMSVEQVRQSACDLPDGAVYNSWFSEMSNTTPSYPRRYCTIQGNPTARYYDRLTRLKDALFTLMDSNQIDSNNVAIGIGQFSSQSESNNVYTAADGFSGKIVVPAAPLT
ncbi:pilus assembly protein PilC, partial [Acinetobacter bereziniae]|nr:pilus assembly protein PilC [Acinetobacter bereziniae]